MSPTPINLAVEDSLSEAVLRRVLSSATKQYAIGTAYSRGGYGYLRKMIRPFNNAARVTPFLVVTDLDDGECAPVFITEWLPETQNGNLIFRVAVREIEAWVLGDQSAVASFLGIRRDLIPDNPETLENPKEFLVQLAMRSRKRELKKDIVPRLGSTSKVGPNYNGRLVEFVNSTWDPRAAAESCDSLSRLVDIADTFSPTWADNQ